MGGHNKFFYGDDIDMDSNTALFARNYERSSPREKTS